MNNPISKLNKSFESRVRLGIMSILMVNERINFKNLKEYLQVTDGNLASHLKALEKLEMIVVKKQFIGRKPNTTYEATAVGKQAFDIHLKALEGLIKGGI